MAKDPAFLWYPSDFTAGTSEYTFKEIGAYVAILNKQFDYGGPLPIDKIKRILRDSFDEVWPVISEKFKKDENGNYYNERLEAERLKRKTFTESRKNSLNINNDDPVHIYLLYNPENELYKIGSSKYPLLRVSDVQKKMPAVYLFWKSDILVKRSIEKELHETFSTKRKTYDWFQLTESDIKSITYDSRFISRTEPRTENENRNENRNEIQDSNEKEKNVPRELKVDLPEKSQMAEEIFNDELFVEELRRGHPKKNIQKAWDECWLYHSQKPSPPTLAWQWRQKLSTWLINTKDGDSKKKNGTDATIARREHFARKHGSGTGG